MHVLSLTPPSAPLAARVSIPGSKSYTNRALLLAAQAHGISRLSSASMSADSEAMITALRQLGVSIHESKEGDTTTLLVEGRGNSFLPYLGVIDVGPAGTTMRFLTALCAAIPGSDVELRGSDRMHQRPIGDLVNALRALGAGIQCVGKEGHPPLRIASTSPLHGGPVTMDGSVSSQFISALLLTAPLNTHPLSIKLSGEQISKSYIDMTIQSVNDFGVAIRNDSYSTYTAPEGARFSARSYQIEGDASGASYLWGLAAISGGSITVDNINPESAQGDVRFPDLLRRMGCTVEVGDRSITVTGTPRLQGIEADMSNMPDTAQTLAVIAATAKGTTTITGLSTLRVKETDRIAALHTELTKVGIRSEAGVDYLVVHGGAPHGAQIATYEDHRMAMSFAMLAAAVPSMRIEEPLVVDKSFPTFWKVLEGIGISHS